MRQQIVTDKAPTPKSPFSQGIMAQGRYVFVSGQGPFDAASGEVKLGSFREQTELTLKNVEAILKAAGTSLAHVVKVNAYLSDRSNFQEWNEIYREHFKPPYPARTTVQAGLGAQAIEVDCIAVIPD